MVRHIKAFLNRLPYIKSLAVENRKLKKNQQFPPGHFYSPIVSTTELKTYEDTIWDSELPNQLSGISLNVETQKALLKHFEGYYDELPFKEIKQKV